MTLIICNLNEIINVFYIKLLFEIGIDKPKTAIIKEINNRGYASGVNRTTRILNQLQKQVSFKDII